MKQTLTVLVLLVATFVVNAQTMYSKAFGNPNDKPLIFLHGGPGYNAVGFEATTAKKLSEEGFYVIVYDRRGEGRSIDKNATFTFNETLDDINLIYTKYNLTSATLIGHSFGGIIATLYAEKYPNKTKSVILVSAPLALQESLATILKSSKSIYIKNKDSVNLNYISMLEKMDKSTMEYASYCFAHAMQNGFYTPKAPTKEAVAIYKTFKTDSLLIKHSSKMTYQAPMGFWKNEKYTTLDLNENIKSVIKHSIPVFGLYGKEDGLFSQTQIKHVENLVGETNLEYFNDCSHNPFVDQHTKFINAIKKWIKDAANDLAQETFIKVWKQLPKFRNEASIGTWIFRIASNTCLRHIQKENRMPKSELPLEIKDDVLETNIEKDTQLLYQYISELQEVERIIISLELEDMNQKEIAKIVGLSEGNIRVKIHRIKEKLTQKFKSNGN